MLRDLHVENLAVIAETSFELGPGLNVLTGQTGAGKSIIVDGLALLSGARASSDLIRSGAEILSLTGVFQPRGRRWRRLLQEAGLGSSGDDLVVRREISREGRNRVFLNDRPVTLGLLASIAPLLIRIHTQREELGLVSPEIQRRWLDRSGGEEAVAARRRVREAYAEYSELAGRLERAQGDERLRRERIDLLRFQRQEIDAAAVQSGEEERLRQERDALRHGEAIAAALSSSYALLFDEDGSAAERMAQALRALKGIAEWEPRSRGWCDDLEPMRLGLEELARDLRGCLETAGDDPVRLDSVEERLAVLDRLMRKYGGSSAAVLDHRRQIDEELEQLSDDVEHRDRLAQRVEEALGRYRQAAAALSTRRRDWAQALTARVESELQELALGKARFGVGLETRARQGSRLALDGTGVEFSADGFDQVSYLLAANPGEAMAPLSRAASGGELSRVYLAVQLASGPEAETEQPTLVFDEVDAGIGGAQAAALGRKLKRLARGGQVLVVTHLPQVASHADLHFLVRKRVAAGRTRTGVERLEKDRRIDEVARMLAGRRVTSVSRSHAEEMIASSGGGGG